MKQLACLLIAVALTVGPALVQGSYLHRWGEPQDLSAAGAAIDRLPEAIGPWRRVDDGRPLSRFVSRELGLVNHLNRWYEHSVTGRRLQVLLMVGQPGPLVRHPPTVCYANRAHEQIGTARWITDPSGAGRGRFRLLTYRPSRSRPNDRFYVAYGHSTGATWDAPPFPRIEYGASPALYKMQVLVNRVGDESEQAIVEDLTGFIDEMMTAFEGTVLVAEPR